MLKPWGWLVLLGIAPLFGLAAVGLVDYDESAYGDVARTMLASGDWLAPKLCGVAFFEKPPLLYWSAALGMKLIGVGPAGVRLATALAGLAAPLVLFGFARRPLGERAAFAAALVLGTGFEFGVLARLAYTDMLLLLWFTVCVGSLHRAFEAPERGLGWFALASGASALAILTKGAIGVLLPGAAGLVELLLRGRLRDALRPSWLATGVVLVFGLGFSWYLALGLTQPGGFTFMRDLFIEHHLGRFSEPMQGHGGNVLYYVPVLLVGLFPWSPFAPLAFARSNLRAGDERARFLRLFALFSGITFVFFSIAATKLANYVAPALPGLALLIGTLLAQPRRERDRPFAWSLGAALGLVGIVALAGFVLPFAAERLPELLGERVESEPGLATGLALGAGPVLAAVAWVAGAGAFRLLWRTRREAALLALGAASVLGCTILFQSVAARVDAQITAPLRRLAVQAAALVPPDQPIAMLGLRHRSSVCFSGERGTAYTSVDDRRRVKKLFFSDGGAPIGITGEPQLARFPARDRLEVLARDGGYVLFRARQ